MADISKIKDSVNNTVYNIVDASAVHTVDSALSSTSSNPVQNKVVNSALAGKLSTTGTAAKATADANGNNIIDTYAKKTEIPTKTSQLTNDGHDGSHMFVDFAHVDTTLDLSSLNPVANAAVLNSINNINGKIPAAATTDNQLADKAFVNSSITTNTATFRGTSATGLTEVQFLAWANGLTKDNNDYVFWNTTDSAGNVVFKRYKYDGSSWAYEYSLNNSSFTSAQWSAINSGITSSGVAAISANTSARHTHSNRTILDGTTASYTTEAQNKLSGIEAGANVNVQSDWSVTDTADDAFIKNKPTIDSAMSSSSTNAVQNKVVNAALDTKVNVTSDSLDGVTTTLLSLAKAMGANNVGYKRYKTSTDGGSANVSDKPTGSTNGQFTCKMVLGRRASATDYHVQLTCWVQGNTNPYVACVNNSTTAISWDRLDHNTTYSSKAAASGGTDLSLVTTGEKYTWNSKQNALPTGTTVSGTYAINVGGNAGTATKLGTARTIAISGGATGTATSFNGTSNITIPVTTLDASKLSGTVPASCYSDTKVTQTLTTDNAIYPLLLGGFGQTTTTTGTTNFSNLLYAIPSEGSITAETISASLLNGRNVVSTENIYLMPSTDRTTATGSIRWVYDSTLATKCELCVNDTYTVKEGPKYYIYSGSPFQEIYAGNLPLADGTSATGTWGISITGNAETATSATTAESATKATQDSSGNVITTTYATKLDIAKQSERYSTVYNSGTAIYGWHIATTNLNGAYRNPYIRAVINITTWSSTASEKTDECLGFIEITERMNGGTISTDKWNTSARLWSTNPRSAAGWCLFQFKNTTNFTSEWYLGHYNSSDNTQMLKNICYCSLSIIPLMLNGTLTFDTSLATLTVDPGTATDYWTTRGNPYIGATQTGSAIGSTTNPVYVDASGQVQKCDGDFVKVAGTNATAAGVSTMINKLGTGASTPEDADYYVCQSAGGGSSDINYYRRPTSALWTYMSKKTTTRYAEFSTGSQALKIDLGSTSQNYFAINIMCTARASSVSVAYPFGCMLMGDHTAGKDTPISYLRVVYPAGTTAEHMPDIVHSGNCIYMTRPSGVTTYSHFTRVSVELAATDISNITVSAISSSDVPSGSEPVVNTKAVAVNSYTKAAVGSPRLPVYVNENGNVVACNTAKAVASSCTLSSDYTEYYCVNSTAVITVPFANVSTSTVYKIWRYNPSSASSTAVAFTGLTASNKLYFNGTTYIANVTIGGSSGQSGNANGPMCIVKYSNTIYVYGY